MPNIFHEQIRTALDNSTLQSALDGNAERRLNALNQAFATLPETRDSLRQRAHAVRADTIANLDHYLGQFIANAQANGIIVHQAATGEEAVQIVLQIARRAHSKVVAKSKSMVSEEIHLNHALETAGFDPVETDLGEYIIQLRHEPPAHIITPAVHLTRTQVGHTFAEKLGIPFTEDIPTLTATARKVLRQTFLDAGLGLSGVNFGVAETGTITMVTNEGNGRMCTTLPPLHVALMGIERLVPTLEDLALMLYLLPRSATGQKLSVYTSLIHGPRRSGEPDGPQERHLVLVDNGRRAMRQSPLAEGLYCIRCGACLNACPIFREIGGHAYQSVNGRITPYPGPIGSIVSPGLFGMAEFGHLARASSLCGACKEACPVDIDLPKLLLRVRAAGAHLEAHSTLPNPSAPGQQNGGPATKVRSHVPGGMRLGLRGFSWIASSPALFSLAQRLAGIFSRIISPASDWLRLPAFTGWGASKDIARPATRPFHDRFAALAAAPATPVPQAPRPRPTEQHPPETPAVSLSSSERVERFSAELAALGGSVTRCAVDELAGRLLEDLHSLEITAIQAWDQAYLPAGLIAALRLGGIQVQTEPDPALKAGLTGALAGIADTGTLVMPGGQGRPQTASLLPEIHFALLRQDDLVGTLVEAMRLPSLRDFSTIVLVSGPSRTADIEMTLTIGVHGPREVRVFIY
jgi:L-lactate dehydrogenase complex protein LldF